MASSYAWTDRNTLVLHSYLVHTPFAATVTCRFNGDELQYQQKVNVSFGPTERPALTGRREMIMNPEYP